MKIKKFNLSEILIKKRISNVDWGFVFEIDGSTRYSFDPNEMCVIVEEVKNNIWTVLTSYGVSRRSITLDRVMS